MKFLQIKFKSNSNQILQVKSDFYNSAISNCSNTIPTIASHPDQPWSSPNNENKLVVESWTNFH